MKPIQQLNWQTCLSIDHPASSEFEICLQTMQSSAKSLIVQSGKSLSIGEVIEAQEQYLVGPQRIQELKKNKYC